MLQDHGLFLAFDGVPRSGRTTYATHIADVLASEENGYTVTRVDLPPPPSLPRSNAGWLAATIAECVRLSRAVIVPALERGEVVIADSWITSALMRARVSMSMPTPLLVAAWTRACEVVTPDVEFLFPEVVVGEPSAITPAANDWSKIVAGLPVAHIPAHPMHPRNERRVFPATLGETRTRRYLAARTLELLRTHNAVIEEGKLHHSEVVAEGPAAREMRLATERMRQWANPVDRSHTPLPRDPEVIEMAIRWPSWSDATREAALALLPDDHRILGPFGLALRAEGVEDDEVGRRYVAAKEAADAEAERVRVETEAAQIALLATADDVVTVAAQQQALLDV